MADDGPLRRAVEALGGRVVSTAPGEPGPIADWIFTAEATAASLPALLERARDGATLVLSGLLPDGSGEPPRGSDSGEPPRGSDSGEPPSGSGARALPWVSAAASGSPAVSSSPGIILLSPGDRAVGAPVARGPGSPAPRARTVATFDDATPAAAARPLGDGCVVYLAANLTAPELTAATDYTDLVGGLVLGCADAGPADGPLDLGALRVIERPDLATRVDVASLVAPEGRSLTPWLIVLALALLGLEMAMTRGERHP